MMLERSAPIAPGTVLLEEYMQPLKLSRAALARGMGVSVDRVCDVVRGEVRITNDTASRLAHYFNTTPGFWLNLQASYDLAWAKIHHEAEENNTE